MLSTACFGNQNTLTFNRPDNVPQANYVLELLTLAYKDIGYEIHLIDFNPQNALRAANNGTLDGQLGRDNSIEVDFPNLLPVNYPLFKFKLILYKNCQQRYKRYLLKKQQAESATNTTKQHGFDF
jgi:hypothetical protein